MLLAYYLRPCLKQIFVDVHMHSCTSAPVCVLAVPVQCAYSLEEKHPRFSQVENNWKPKNWLSSSMIRRFPKEPFSLGQNKSMYEHFYNHFFLQKYPM